MQRQRPRVPASCPPGFQGRYTVRSGDTMYRIAQIFRTRLEALVVNNPHIPDPNLIFPGDVLCVPAQIPIPCSVVLQEKIFTLPFGTSGAAFAHFDFSGTEAVTVAATLPPPSTFGNFDIYLAVVIIPEVDGGPGDQLFPTPEDPATWAATIDLPTVIKITPASTVHIRPSNSQTGIDGPIILEGSFANCCRRT